MIDGLSPFPLNLSTPFPLSISIFLPLSLSSLPFSLSTSLPLSISTFLPSTSLPLSLSPFYLIQYRIDLTVSQMGLSHSVPESDLIQEYNPQDWKLVDRTMESEVWQHQATGKRFMAFVVNLDQNAEENVKLYEFRKVNKDELIAPELILRNRQDYGCLQQDSYHLLIENIPARLSLVNKFLNIQERFSILAVVFSALHTLSYRYGPAFLTEHMIGFNEKGHIKVWVSDMLWSNQPTFYNSDQPRGTTEGEFPQQRIFHCISEVFRILSNWRADTFPLDFREEAITICTFEEGERFVIDYCKANDIRLLRTIPFMKYLQQQSHDNQANQGDNYGEDKDNAHNYTFAGVQQAKGKNKRQNRENRENRENRDDRDDRDDRDNRHNRQNKVTVLESVVHEDKNQLFAHFQILSENSNNKLPPPLSEVRTMQQPPRGGVQVQPMNSQQRVSSMNHNNPPATAIRQPSLDAGRAQTVNSHPSRIPLLSPKQVHQPAGNPAIRFQNPPSSTSSASPTSPAWSPYSPSSTPLAPPSISVSPPPPPRVYSQPAPARVTRRSLMAGPSLPVIQQTQQQILNSRLNLQRTEQSQTIMVTDQNSNRQGMNSEIQEMRNQIGVRHISSSVSLLASDQKEYTNKSGQNQSPNQNQNQSLNRPDYDPSNVQEVEQYMKNKYGQYFAKPEAGRKVLLQQQVKGGEVQQVQVQSVQQQGQVQQVQPLQQTVPRSSPEQLYMRYITNRQSSPA